MKRYMIPVAMVSTLAMNGTALAAGPGDAAAGKEKSALCVACHGTDGNSEQTIYPILAGQYRDYLVQALKDYKNGGRNNAIMKGFAAGLSDEDILNLAAYYSQQSSNLKTPDPD